MFRKLFLNVSLCLGFVCFLLLLSACVPENPGYLPVTPGSTQTTTTVPTATPGSTQFAAYVGNSGGQIIQTEEQETGNVTTIHSAVDRPAAFITQPYLSVPPKARGQVLIQNNSANPQTLVSDTSDGFASFTIAPYTTTTLIFTRAGSFRSHLQNFPDVTLTIFISAPYS